MISENSVKRVRTPSTWSALGYGAIAGMRALSAPAALWKGSGLKLLAAGELIGDKLPFTPSRIKPFSMAARVVSGALAGARSQKRSGHVVVGAVLGVAGAIGAAYGLYHLRKRLGQRFGIPDAVVGLAEDALMAGLALRLAHGAPRNVPAPAESTSGSR